jgi:ubiquinol-cytochrome c reductase cytochrome c subunit
MLTGPGQMPVFDLGQESIAAVATYVDFLQDADDPGGFEIGGIGPVPEGFVAWLVGMGLLIGVVYLVGRQWDRTGHRS